MTCVGLDSVIDVFIFSNNLMIRIIKNVLDSFIIKGYVNITGLNALFRLFPQI